MGRELGELATIRRKTEARDHDALRVLKTQESAERQAQRDRLAQHQEAEGDARARLAVRLEDNAARADGESDARKAEKAGPRNLLAAGDHVR